jgi:hypothetical protein
MGAFDDHLGNMINVTLNVRVPGTIRNALVKDEVDRSRIPAELEDCQLRHWGFYGRAMTVAPPKIGISTNQQSELIAAWHGNAVHVGSENRLTARTRDVRCLKKCKLTIDLLSDNRRVPFYCLSVFILKIVNQTTVKGFAPSQADVCEAGQ